MVRELTIEDICKSLGVWPNNPFPKLFRKYGFPAEAVEVRQRVTPELVVKLTAIYYWGYWGKES